MLFMLQVLSLIRLRLDFGWTCDPQILLYQNQPKSLLKKRLLEPIPRVSNSVDLWLRICILIYSYLMMMMLTWGPYFENH